MKLSDERYEYIKEIVCDLLFRLRVKCMPVSGFEIASKLKITLVPYSSLSKRKLEEALKIDPDGFYCENNEHEFGKEYIYYNDIDCSYRRINMTILHEIGHCVLDHIGNSEEEEAEAKFFAKYAIAPPVLVHKIHPFCPEQIMEYFDISYQAAIYSFNYYRTWKALDALRDEYPEYERKLLKLYRINKRIGQGGDDIYECI